MADYTLGWSEVALDAYIALPPETQQLIDIRIAQLCDKLRFVGFDCGRTVGRIKFESRPIPRRVAADGFRPDRCDWCGAVAAT